MFEDLSGAGLAAALAGVNVGSLDADAALGYALAAARLAGWVAAAEGAGLAQLKQTYPAFESAADEEVHRLGVDRLVITEVRAAYGCSQVAASIKISFAQFLRDIPAVRTPSPRARSDSNTPRLLDRETAPLAGNLSLRTAVIEELLAGHCRCRRGHGFGMDAAAVEPGALAGRCWKRTRPGPSRPRPTRGPSGGSGTASMPRTRNGTFGLVGPVEQTAACHATVDAFASRWQTEGRAGTLDQLRFDAAVALFTGVDQHHSPGAGLVGQVTIPLSSPARSR